MIVLVGIVFARGFFSSGMTSEAERLSQDVTIRCMESGQEWTMNRGQFEMLLLEQPGAIDAAKGIPSPYADGRPTGVLVDKRDWQQTVDRINAEKRVNGLLKP
ncbi:MAG: hypothetical protein R3B57_09635 [Phycisphaerales bacterium]